MWVKLQEGKTTGWKTRQFYKMLLQIKTYVLPIINAKSVPTEFYIYKFISNFSKWKDKNLQVSLLVSIVDLRGITIRKQKTAL